MHSHTVKFVTHFMQEKVIPRFGVELAATYAPSFYREGILEGYYRAEADLKTLPHYSEAKHIEYDLINNIPEVEKLIAGILGMM